MATGQPTAIAFRNLAADGSATILASSSLVLTPPSILQDPLIARKWRGRLGESEYLTIDLGSAQEIDTVLLRGLNLTAAGVTRLRISTADTSAQDGSAYDSGAAAARVDPVYATLLFLLTVPVTGRYIRLDLNEPGADYIEAGRLAVFKRHVLEFGISFGPNDRWIDRSGETESDGGQDYIDEDVSRRCWTMSIPLMSETFANDVWDELDRTIGIRHDFLVIRNVNGANLGRDSLWGRRKQIAGITQPNAFVDEHGAFSTSFEIYERL